MKKKLLIGIGALLLCAVGVVAYFETHFATFEFREVSMSEKQILAEMPSLKITKEDRQLEDLILNLPEVKDASKDTTDAVDAVALPLDAIQEQVASYLPQNAKIQELGVIGNMVCFSFSEESTKRTYMEFFRDGQTPSKTIGLYRVDRAGHRDCTAVYENRDGSLKKYRSERRWFSYIRDRLWEK